LRGRERISVRASTGLQTHAAKCMTVHRGLGRRDRACHPGSPICADLVIVPTWGLNRLRGRNSPWQVGTIPLLGLMPVVARPEMQGQRRQRARPSGRIASRARLPCTQANCAAPGRPGNPSPTAWQSSSTGRDCADLSTPVHLPVSRFVREVGTIARSAQSAFSGARPRDPWRARQLFVVDISRCRLLCQRAHAKAQRQKGIVRADIGDTAEENVSTTGLHAQRSDIVDTPRALQSLGVVPASAQRLCTSHALVGA
jgi:hypothetical protein